MLSIFTISPYATGMPVNPVEYRLGMQIRNPSLEIRNNIKIQKNNLANRQSEYLPGHTLLDFGPLVIGISFVFRDSNFGFRIGW